MTADHLKELVRELVDRLRDDISKAVTREEHIRMSARANEAHHLSLHLHSFLAHSESADGIMTDDNDTAATD